MIGAKNPKIRFYGGSESNDFRVACGVAQTNLTYGYIKRTLQALNIEPGYFCTEFGEKMTTQALQDKLRKQTARKEAQEGKTYESGIGLNLGQTVFATLTESQFKDIESTVPQYTARPLPKKFHMMRTITTIF